MNQNDFMKFIINLDKRQDRMTETLSEMKKLGIDDAKRFSAIPGNNGVIGCASSHLWCLGIALNNQRNVMIFEDDVMFINDYKEIFEQSLKELDQVDDWAIWYGGANICAQITQISPHLGRLTHAQSTHCLAVNLKYIGQILTIIPQLYNTPLDLIYSEIVVKNFPCYISIPMMAIQRPSFSDVERNFADYTGWMEDRFYANLKKTEVDT